MCQSSTLGPAWRNRNLPTHFLQGWFSAMTYMPPQGLHCIKKLFQSRRAYGSPSFLKPCYLLHIPLSTPVFSVYIAYIVYLCGPVYICYSCVKGMCIWISKFRVQGSLDDNCCHQLVSDLNELPVLSLWELFSEVPHPRTDLGVLYYTTFNHLYKRKHES